MPNCIKTILLNMVKTLTDNINIFWDKLHPVKLLMNYIVFS